MKATVESGVLPLPNLTSAVFDRSISGPSSITQVLAEAGGAVAVVQGAPGELFDLYVGSTGGPLIASGLSIGGDGTRSYTAGANEFVPTASAAKMLSLVARYSDGSIETTTISYRPTGVGLLPIMTITDVGSDFQPDANAPAPTFNLTVDDTQGLRISGVATGYDGAVVNIVDATTGLILDIDSPPVVGGVWCVDMPPEAPNGNYIATVENPQPDQPEIPFEHMEVAFVYTNVPVQTTDAFNATSALNADHAMAVGGTMRLSVTGYVAPDGIVTPGMALPGADGVDGVIFNTHTSQGGIRLKQRASFVATVPLDSLEIDVNWFNGSPAQVGTSGPFNGVAMPGDTSNYEVLDVFTVLPVSFTHATATWDAVNGVARSAAGANALAVLRWENVAAGTEIAFDLSTDKVWNGSSPAPGEEGNLTDGTARMRVEDIRVSRS